MLVQFSVKNFRTFREGATLSLVASNYDKAIREADNVVSDERFNLRLLKSAVVYGANASGKSKLLDALAFMRYFVRSSSKDTQQGDEIGVEPFRLNTRSESAPSEFEVVFIVEERMYRYGFAADRKRVVSEWLYYKPKVKEIELFYRDSEGTRTHKRSFAKGRTVAREGLVRNNALLLSVAAQFNDGTATEVVEWFQRLGMLSGVHDYGYRGFTMHQAEDAGEKAKILELLKAADLGIQDLEVEKFSADNLPKDMPKEMQEEIIRLSKGNKTASFFFDVLTYRRKYDEEQLLAEMVPFSLEQDESSGTQKFFDLAGPVLSALESGQTLVVDELDSKLHPNLVCRLVSLFNSARLNPKHAQLIFNTHDTNLLASGLFRRDQIWFTEKDRRGEAHLYPLSDFEVRKGEALEPNYLRGKYGAVPYLGFFDELPEALADPTNGEA